MSMLLAAALSVATPPLCTSYLLNGPDTLALDLTAEALSANGRQSTTSAKETAARLVERQLLQTGAFAGRAIDSQAVVVWDSTDWKCSVTIQPQPSVLGFQTWDVLVEGAEYSYPFQVSGKTTHPDDLAEQTALQLLGYSRGEVTSLRITRALSERSMGVRLGYGVAFLHATELYQLPNRAMQLQNLSARDVAGMTFGFFGRRRYTEFEIGGTIPGTWSDLYLQSDIYIFPLAGFRLSHRSIATHLDSMDQERATLDADFVGFGLVLRFPSIRVGLENGWLYRGTTLVNPVGWKTKDTKLDPGKASLMVFSFEYDIHTRLSLQARWQRTQGSTGYEEFHWEGLPSPYVRKLEFEGNMLQASLGWRMPY